MPHWRSGLRRTSPRSAFAHNPMLSPRFVCCLLLLLMAGLAGCQTSGDWQGIQSSRVTAAAIQAEPPGDYFIGRRYYKVDYKFWGYLRQPGQPWKTAKLVMLNEQEKLAPDRAQGHFGSDNGYEYKILGNFSGQTVYEPASNGFYPEFILKGYELRSISPPRIFSVAGALDPKRRIIARPN